MSLKEQIAADADLFLNFEDFGEEVVYTRKEGGAVQPLPILFHQGMTMVGGQLVAIETEATAIFAVAAMTPAAGDFFTRANGESWKIDRNSRRDSDGVYWRIHVVRDRLAVLGRG